MSQRIRTITRLQLQLCKVPVFQICMTVCFFPSLQPLTITLHAQVLNGTDLIAEGKISAAKKDSHKTATETSDREAADLHWSHDSINTVDADAFYRDVSRTGITYGPCFRMVQKASTDGSQALMRCSILLLTPICDGQ